MVQGRIIKRLLGQPAVDSSSDQSTVYEGRVDTSFPRPTSSQSARLHIASSIACVDKSPSGEYAVIAGEEVLKTVKVDGPSITEGIDLRAAITTQVSSHDHTISSFNEQLNIKSAKWAHGDLGTTIVTASANGRVTLYDINRLGSGVEIGRIREHARQVHKLAINPFRGNWLLSASQDGTARLFDIRSAATGRPGQIFNSWHVFRCNADSVRDIQWSSTDGFKFACSTGSGNILQWDTRKPNVPILKINKAHDSACLSISWHPDGKHLISGGFDQRCYVWDLSEDADKRQKPKYTINTPAPVSIVSWRPPCWSSTAQAKRAAQVVVVYDDTNTMKTQNSTVHIWDVARPSLPFKEIVDFETSPTGLLWHERDLLWTVGKEGVITQTDVAFAPKVIDRRSLSTFDFSPLGEALMLLEERKGPVRLRSFVPPLVATEITSQPINPEVQSQSLSLGQLSISRSDSDEDINGSFLGPRIRSRNHGQRHSPRPPTTLSTTPPSTNYVDKKVMNLDEAMKATGVYKPQQVMAVGHTPSATRREEYRYLASRYLQRLELDVNNAVGDSSNCATSDRVTSILLHFAESAESVGHFRLAQTWRMLSFTTGLLLTRRAQYHCDHRLKLQEQKKAEREKQERRAVKDTERQEHLQGEITPRNLPRPKSPKDSLTHTAIKSIITEEIESTSNMTTPLARPMRDSMIFDPVASAHMSTIDYDKLQLPEAAKPLSLNPVKIPHQVRREEIPTFDAPMSSLDDHDYYDMTNFTTQAIDIAAPPRKVPLRLDLQLKDHGESSRISSLARHDSNESFEMFSTSADSQPRKFPSPSESGGIISLPKRSIPDVDSSWESSEAASNSRVNTSFESEPKTEISLSIEEEYGVHIDNAPDLMEPSPLPPTLRVQKPSPSFKANEIGDMQNGNDDISDIYSLQGVQESFAHFLYSDYLPKFSDPPFLVGPLDPHLLVQRSMQFENHTGSLNASMMILLLKPFLSDGTIDDVQSASILRLFHHRLDSMMLFTEAALLRKLCYPLYPSVYSQGQPKNIGSMGYYCTTCRKPVQEGELALGQRMQKCYRCNTYFEGCAVCNMREEPPPVLDTDFNQAQSPEEEGENPNKSAIPGTSSPAARLWWWCQGCGHGGHTSCMRTWHSSDGADFSDGCCPLEGCLHPCLPGNWRNELFSQQNATRSEELNKLVKESTRGGPKGLRAGGVKRDKTEVVESGAVQSVRGTLAQSGDKEKKKSVKVVAPGEK